MKLQGQQEIFYVVSGRGTVTSAGETSELHDGVGILVPPGVEFSMKNTGDEDLKEEVWIQIKGRSLAFIGTQLRWQTPGMGYLAPPFAEQTQENVRNGLSFPHSNINPGPGQVKFLYFQTARRPAPTATAAQPTPR